MKDPYEILGISADADAASVKKAYKRLAKEFHPDITGGDERKTAYFRQIREAYVALADQHRRSAHAHPKSTPAQPDAGMGDVDIDAAVRKFVNVRDPVGRILKGWRRLRTAVGHLAAVAALLTIPFGIYERIHRPAHVAVAKDQARQRGPGRDVMPTPSKVMAKWPICSGRLGYIVPCRQNADLALCFETGRRITECNGMTVDKTTIVGCVADCPKIGAR